MITLLNKPLINIQQDEDTRELFFNINKEVIESIPQVAANPSFSDDQSWEMVSLVYKKTTSSLRFTPTFRKTRNSIKVRMKSNVNSGDVFQLTKIIISKKDRGQRLIIKRQQLEQQNLYDFTINSGSSEENLPPSAPTELVVSLSGFAPLLNFRASFGATSYKIYRGTSSSNLSLIATAYTNSYQDSSALKGTSYIYSVKANNGLDSAFSNNSSITTPVDSPSNLSASNLSDGTVSLSWSAVNGAISYKIFKGLGQNSLVEIATSSSPTYNDTDVAVGATYFYAVSSYNGSNSPSPSSSIDATGYPSAPSNFSVSLIDGVPSLSWTSISNAQYKIFRSSTSGQAGSEIASAIESNEYSDSSASAGVTYYYTISVVINSLESSKSQESSVFVSLMAPVNLGISLSNRKPSLNWSDVNGATFYNVYRSSNNSNYALITTTSISEYIDEAAPVGTSYYKVSATNALTESSLTSYQESLVPPSKPSSPEASTSTSSASLSWPSVSGADSYTILRGSSQNDLTVLVSGLSQNSYSDTTVSSGGDYYYAIIASNGEESEASNTLLVNIPLVPPSIAANASVGQVAVNWAEITGAYSYKIFRGESSSSLSLLAENISGGSYVDTTVVKGSTYFYGVKSVDEVDSEMSSLSSATVPLDAPSSVSALTTTDNIRVSWSEVSGAISYKVFRGTSSGALSFIATVEGSNLYVDSSVDGSTRYYYAIKTFNNSDSNLSSEANALSAPLAPQNFSSVLQSNKPTLSWDAVSGVDGSGFYAIFRGTSSSNLTQLTEASSITFSDGSALDGNTYYYAVKAYNGQYSVLSSIIEVSLPARTVTNLSAARGAGALDATVDLTWSPLGGASYTYKIYSGTSESNVNTLVATTSFNASTINIPTSFGTQQYYAIQPVQNGVSSAKSNVVAFIALSSPSGVTLSQTNNLINVSWSAVTGATSYEVRRVVGSSSVVVGTTSSLSLSDVIKTDSSLLSFSEVSLAQSFDTAHPYLPYTTLSRSYTFSGASAVYFTFDAFETERLYDTLKLFDSGSNLISTHSGTLAESGGQTGVANTGTTTLVFNSDATGNSNGITITKAQVSYDLLNSASQFATYYVVAKKDSFASMESSNSITTIKKPSLSSSMVNSYSRRLTFSSSGQTSFDIDYGLGSTTYGLSITGASSPRTLNDLVPYSTHYARVTARRTGGSYQSDEISFFPSPTISGSARISGPFSTSSSSFTALSLTGIASNGTITVISTSISSGSYLTSTDSGSSWTTREISGFGGTNNVVYVNGFFWMLGGAIIARSSNGTTWTTSSVSGGGTLYNLTYTGTNYVLVGHSGVIFTSTNGTSWTQRTSGTTSSLRSVAAAGGTVVASTNASSTTPFIRSTDHGVTWSAVTGLAASATINSMIYVAGSVNKFFAVGNSGKIFSSGDGSAFNPVTSPTTGNLNDIIQGSSSQNLWIAGNGSGSSGRICYSTNGGVSWIAVSGISGVDWYRRIAYTGSKYVTLTDLTSKQIMVSSNGTTWPTTMSTPINTYNTYSSFAINSICKNSSGVMVAGGAQGRIARSTDDGQTWTHPTNNVLDILSIATSGSTFVAVGSLGAAYYSNDDGQTWSSCTGLPITDDLNDVTFGDGKFVICSDSGIFHSSNGISWTAATTLPTSTLSTVFYAQTDSGSKVFLAGGTGTLCRSTDGGVNWTSVKPVGYSGVINSISYGNGYFVAVTSTSVILYSTDGVTWTSKLVSGSGKSIVFARGSFFVYSSSTVMYVFDNPATASYLGPISIVGTITAPSPKALFFVSSLNKIFVANPTSSGATAQGGAGILEVTMI